MKRERTARTACDDNWCPIERTLGAIGGIWKVIIIRELLTGTKRYGYLHRTIGGVTHKMLTQQLRELERDGLLHREVYKEVPPKVEYSLTPLGNRLAPVLQAMHAWGKTLPPLTDEVNPPRRLPGKTARAGVQRTTAARKAS